MADPKHTGILLTEADCFMYTLEKHMIRQEEGTTNVCHYVLDVKGVVDVEKFKTVINRLDELQWLATLAPLKTSMISIPAWKSFEKVGSIPVNVINSDELIPAEILNEKLKKTDHQIRFTIVNRSNGNSAIVMSWHHLIMDGYAAVLLLQQLAKSDIQKMESVIDENPKEMLGAAQLKNAARAKFFIDKVSRQPLTSIAPKQKLEILNQKVKTIIFSEEETAAIDKLGMMVGARFGRSPLYLAAASRAIQAVLQKRGVPVKNLWIPVPKDLRKKGSTGPLLGNHTSLMFYRLKGNTLSSFSETVLAINEQMLSQVKKGISRDYDMLIRMLRRTPTPLYYFWVKGLRGGTLASFLFTVAADHPDNLMNFQGQEVTSAWSFPSGVYPPGLSFAFMRFKNTLQLMINYFEGVVNDDEIELMSQSIKQDLVR